MGSYMAHATGATPGGVSAKYSSVAQGGARLPESRHLLRRAALYCNICSMLENNVNQEKGNQPEMASGLPCLGKNSSFKQFSKVGYEDAKTWMERRLARMKSSIPNWAATAMAMEWWDQLDPVLANLDPRVMEIEAANLAKHYERWHVPRLGSMPAQRPDVVFRIMGGQMNSASSAEVRLRKSQIWYVFSTIGRFKEDACWKWGSTGVPTLFWRTCPCGSEMKSPTCALTPLTTAMK
jgi:hypothetical protein